MPINFPDSPVFGERYEVDDRVWRWNGSGWERIVNAGQVVSFFVLVHINAHAISEFPSPNDGAWTLLNHI